jgi:hypothetical protein
MIFHYHYSHLSNRIDYAKFHNAGLKAEVKEEFNVSELSQLQAILKSASEQ